MQRFYAGVGSRKAPAAIRDQMRRIAVSLRGQGFILRSGGADGADSAFESGAGDDCDILVPWPNFNDRPHGQVPPDPAAAMALAEKYHAGWRNCSRAARAIHDRNVCIVIGPDLTTPAEFLIYWTADGRASGGTGQAVRTA